MTPREIAYVIASSRAVLGSCVLGGLLIALSVDLLTTTTFSATTQVFVSVRTGSSMSELLQGSTFTQQQSTSYTDIASSDLVLEPVVHQLGLDLTAAQLAENVSAQSPIGTSLINIVAKDGNASRAAAIANAVADSLASQVRKLEQTRGYPSPVDIVPVRHASVPSAPSTPNWKLLLALGLAVGLAVGAVAIWSRQIFSRRVDLVSLPAVLPADVFAIGSSLRLGGFEGICQPLGKRRGGVSGVVSKLLGAVSTKEVPVIMAASVGSPRGRNAIASTLALGLALMRYRVVIIDVPSGKPTAESALTDVLAGRLVLNDAVSWVTEDIGVIVADPSSLDTTDSASIGQVVAEVKRMADVVVLNVAADAGHGVYSKLAETATGAVLAVRARRTRRAEVELAVNVLRARGLRIYGVVVFERS